MLRILRLMTTTQERRIAKYIEPAITDLGYDLVSLRIIGSQKLQTLQIMAENPETQTLDLDGCTKISRAVSALLDVEDPFAGAYQLEISSPGIDRPLVRGRDFENNVGFEASVETETAAENGQKKFRGKITAFADDIVTLDTEHGTVKIDLPNIHKAKLVMTDDLLKASKEKRERLLNSTQQGD